MASHGPPTIETPEPPSGSGAKFVEYNEFIEAQLRKTRSHVRGVDISAGLMALVAGSVAYFFLAAMIDHWLVRGGLGFWGRLLLLVGYLGAAGWWIATQLLPLLVKRINPLYAAYTIEHSRPSLKNSLLNFLLFRADPAGVHQRVFEAIEEQAATNLAGVEVESAVDRTRLIRLGYVLVAIVALCAVYALVSPKNLFQTVGRVVMPWADITPPTSTTIDEIEPGFAQAFRGQRVTIKARVQGLPADQPVVLYYTTADRQIVDRTVAMTRPAGDYRYAAALPAGDAALQQSLTYRIEAGDARTREYAIDVVAAPTIVVRAVEYKYPEYTGLLAQRIENQGDLKAIEGTEVTIEALANQQIAAAYVDFDCNDTFDLPLRGADTHAKGSFRLSLADDREGPSHESYQLVFKNTEGQRNPQPVKHEIEVTRDLAPEVQFVAPSREEIELPLDAAVDLEVVAVDPDFALSSVKLAASKGTETVVDEKLLDETWRGQFVKKYRFQPGRLNLAVGDTVEYRAMAVDNKSPRPNQTETSRRRIRIVAATGRSTGDPLARGNSPDDPRRQGDAQQPGGDDAHPRSADPAEPDHAAQGQAGDERSSDNSGATERKPGEERGGNAEEGEQGSDSSASKAGSEGNSQSGDGKQGEQNAGESGKGQDGAGQSGSKQSGGEKSGQQQSGEKQADGKPSSDGQTGASDSGDQQQSVPSDGTNDGEAFERILKHRDQQEESSADNQQGRDGQAGDKQQSGEQQRSGDQQNGQPAGEQKGDQQGGDDRSARARQAVVRKATRRAGTTRKAGGPVATERQTTGWKRPRRSRTESARRSAIPIR